jgi:hypothetical protein
VGWSTLRQNLGRVIIDYFSIPMQRTGTFASIDLSQMFIFIILENDLIEVDHLISF